jgi:pyruvate/2-oxoglutarate dehydrogenase complex dihydrolipoamide acyltransferase (E2) component
MPYKVLDKNHYLSTQVGLVKEWRAQDVVSFSQLVDFTSIEQERSRRSAAGLARPSYTAFIVHSIAKALLDHPKMNRIVYRSLTGYRWAQFDRVDIAVAVEVVQNGVDMAYASIIRNAGQMDIEGIHAALVQLAAAPADDKQLKRLQRMPAGLTAFLARATGRHPKLWVRFRGGACALTSPAKYGGEAVTVKSCWPLQFAFGQVAERPMVVEGACVARRSAYLALSWHRELTTGAVAARFFAQVIQQLQTCPAGSREQSSSSTYSRQHEIGGSLNPAGLADRIGDPP